MQRKAQLGVGKVLWPEHKGLWGPGATAVDVEDEPGNAAWEPAAVR